MLGPTFSCHKETDTLVIAGPLFIDKIVINQNENGEFEQTIIYVGSEKVDPIIGEVNYLGSLLEICKKVPVTAKKGEIPVRLAMVKGRIVAMGHSVADKWVVVNDASTLDLIGLQAYTGTDKITLLTDYAKAQR